MAPTRQALRNGKKEVLLNKCPSGILNYVRNAANVILFVRMLPSALRYMTAIGYQMRLHSSNILTQSEKSSLKKRKPILYRYLWKIALAVNYALKFVLLKV